MNANDAAYPSNFRTLDDSDTKYCDFGLTKREYFAAMAMQGMASPFGNPQNDAKASVAYADALLIELEKPQ